MMKELKVTILKCESACECAAKFVLKPTKLNNKNLLYKPFPIGQ